MKKIFLTFISTLLLFSCSIKLIPNYNGKNSPIGFINNEIESRNVNHKTPIYLEKTKISLEELKILNTIDAKEFTSIKVLSKIQANEIIDSNLNQKVIQMIPFRDELLDKNYYSDISNEFINGTITTLLNSGQINSNPLLILDGIPLRGDEISLKINNLKKSDIKSMSLLKKQAAYALYGIRAINGVIIISTK